MSDKNDSNDFDVQNSVAKPRQTQAENLEEHESDDLSAKSCTPIDPSDVNGLGEEDECSSEAHALEASATNADFPCFSQPDFVEAHGSAKMDGVGGKSCSPI